MKSSIRIWLIAPLIGFCVVPLLLVGTFLSWQNYNIEKDQVKRLQKQITIMASDNISFYINEQSLKVITLLKANNLPAMSQDQQQRLVSNFLFTSKDYEHGHAFDEFSILDEKGKEFFRVSRIDYIQTNDLRDKSGSDEFIIPFTTGETYFSPIHFRGMTDEPLIKMSEPIRDLRTFEVKGVLTTEIKLNYLWKLLADMRIGKNGSAFITNYDGQVFAHSNSSFVIREMHMAVPEMTTIMKGLSGKKAVVAAEKIHFGQQFMLLVTEIPTSEALRHIHRSILFYGSFLLFMLFGAVALGFIIVFRIISPIESLAKTAKDISRGDFSQKTPLKRNDEIGELATAFNTMTSRLVESIEAHKKEKDFVKNTIDSLSHPFYVIDANDYTINLANSAAGFDIRTGKETCYQLTHFSDSPCEGIDHPCTLVEVKKTKKPTVKEHIHYFDGRKKTYEVYGYPIFDDHGEISQVIEYNIDITNRKNLEEQLLQAQKLEAIGILAGGVAHDFNNILTVIMGYSELSLMTLSQDDPLRKNMEVINIAGSKAVALTGQLLAFSRKQVMEIKVINLNFLIKNMMKMLGRLIGEDIEMKMQLQDRIGNIKADPVHIEQIIMNLTINAKDAMPDGGNLFFETNTIELDEEYSRIHPEVSPGSYVMFSVTDTGHGMTPKVKEKIFDPFYTTKKKWKGTGLGLATVYGITKQLKAHIYVYSEPNKGTTFKIYFPEAKDVAADLIAKETKKVPRGSETILVVDDEASIVALLGDTFRPLGYLVLEASCGADAIEISNAMEGTIDMLITDVIMPGMSGKELADTLGPMRPEMKVLFMSGYTDNVIAHKGVLEPDVLFINKPLIPSQVIIKIREILDKA